jgi:hypothetical protein
VKLFVTALATLLAVPTLTAQGRDSDPAQPVNPPLACALGLEQQAPLPHLTFFEQLRDSIESVLNDVVLVEPPNGPPVGPSATTWFCAYGDGTVVFNSFRSSRTYTEVRNYFRGYPYAHDCHAWYFFAGRRYIWCTYAAPQFARQHGGIFRIGRA